MAKPKNKFGVRTNMNISPDVIVRASCEYFDIEVDRLFADTKERKYTNARRIAFYLMRILSGYSSGKTAEEYGYDIKTIDYHLGVINKKIKDKKEDKQWVEDIKKKIFIRTNGIRKKMITRNEGYGLPKSKQLRRIIDL
jgi:chromosomal replication initiator protein